MMHLISYVFGGAVLANAVPHLVAALMGRALQSPFAKPPGEGLSSSTVNAFWGFFNLVIGYLLVFRVGTFDIRDNADAIALGLGILGISVMLARSFGRFNGGNAAQHP